ncbi:hypothetical protein ES705_09401 [subsurface metagenome]
MHRTEFIQGYLDKGFSLIPLKNNSKVPAIRWKRYQYKRANLEEVLSWYVTFGEPNIAIITGFKIVVIDADDPSKLPELFKLLPEAEKTTRVKTKRCFHFYFSNNGKHKIKSTKNLFGLGIELKANGNYVVSPPSKIDNFTYHFVIPLSKILPSPEKIIRHLEVALPGIETGIKEGGQAPGVEVEYKKRRALSFPRYNGQDRYCLKQILGKELKAGEKGNKGERDSSLFILYNLLLQNKNRLDHAKKIAILKNNSLVKPLTDQELKKIFRKRYRFKCSTIRETLPYIECSKCKYRFKGGVLGVANILIKNIRKLLGLSNTESRIALLLGTYYEGEYPSMNKIAEETKMNFDTVKNAIKVLKEKGIIDKSFYN